jgi:uncharacterized protein
LYEAAAEPKQFLLVEGGSHHNTNQVGLPQYRLALAGLLGIKPPALLQSSADSATKAE